MVKKSKQGNVKKSAILSVLVFLVLCVLFLPVRSLRAETTGANSSTCSGTLVGTVLNETCSGQQFFPVPFDFGVPGYPESQIGSVYSGEGSEPLFEHEGTNTILAMYIYATSGAIADVIIWNGVTYAFDPTLANDAHQFNTYFWASKVPVYIDNGAYLSGPGVYAIVQWVPYDIRVGTSTDTFRNLGDIKFVLAIILTLLFLVFVAYIYNRTFKSRKW